jgi:magnesium-transporting ATPase (P-type)
MPRGPAVTGGVITHRAHRERVEQDAEGDREAELSITVGVAVVLIIVLNAAVAFVQERRTRSLRSVGVFSSRYLLWAIAGELAIAAVFMLVPPCQALLGSAAPSAHDMLLLIPFPFIVWGADKLRQVGDPESFLAARAGRHTAPAA